jgi:autotransporter-associated beta strand protein
MDTVTIARIARSKWIPSLAAALLLLLPGLARGQGTRVWNKASTTETRWLIVGNWSGSQFPGTFSTDPTASARTDIARFTTISPGTSSGVTGVGIDFGTSQTLNVGAIDFNLSAAGGTIVIGNSSDTNNGVLQLNGAHTAIDPDGVGPTAPINNVLISVSNSAVRDLTIRNTFPPNGTRTMGVRLGRTDGVLYVNAGRTLSILSDVSEATAGSGLTLTGGGTLVLGGNNTYTGTTTVNAGTLRVSGTHAGPVALNAGVLTGTGTLGNVTVGPSATLAPGNSPGVLSLTGNLALQGTYAWQLGDGATPLVDPGPAGTAGAGTFFDMTAVAGDITVAGATLALDLSGLLDGEDPDPGHPFWTQLRRWKIIDSTGGGTTTGNFAAVTGGAFAAGTFSTEVGTGPDAGDVFLVFTPVPESASVVGLILSSGAAFGLLRRRRR